MISKWAICSIYQDWLQQIISNGHTGNTEYGLGAVKHLVNILSTIAEFPVLPDIDWSWKYLSLHL